LLSIEAGYRSEGADVVRREYETRFPLLRAAIGSLPPFGHEHDDLSAGTQLGDFQIQQRIGAGGMGVVYEARDLKLERNVALKVLPSVFANDTDRVDRFEREAKVLAALNHPNIATLHGFEEHHGFGFLSSS
jgi:serine/threonine protein kinase